MEQKIFTNVMVDLETMGKDSYSAIVSIGAVGFDISNGETGPEFYCNVNLQSSLDYGLKVNGSTIMWWLDQSSEAKKSLTNPVPWNLKDALTFFSTWLQNNFNTNEVLLWGNSARFDLGILQNAYEKTNVECPWQFRNERCVRTLVSFYPSIKKEYIHVGVDHNALSDCHKQIGYCSLIWNKLKDQQTK
jgi:hypothetical protein